MNATSAAVVSIPRLALQREPATAKIPGVADAVARWATPEELRAARHDAHSARSRQTHFDFYVQPEPSTGAPDPGKKQPSPASDSSDTKGPTAKRLAGKNSAFITAARTGHRARSQRANPGVRYSR